MRNIILLTTVITVFLSCHQDISVNMSKEPGIITGKVLPLGIEAVVELYQGGFIDRVTADANGYFAFEGLNPGYYRIIVKADNYGTVERSAWVYDGEGSDIGTIELSTFPYPLTSVIPNDGATYVSVKSQIILNFSKNMDFESLKNAFDISPDVENLHFSSSNLKSFIIVGDFKLSTQYTLNINSSAHTLSGENMEFSYSSTFKTEPFKIEDFRYSTSHNKGFFPVQFYFNSKVDCNEFLNYLTIEPQTDIYTDVYSDINATNIYIYPSYCWMSDTTIVFHISRELTDVDGASLEGENSFAVIMPPLRVVSTDPSLNQQYVEINYLQIMYCFF